MNRCIGIDALRRPKTYLDGEIPAHSHSEQAEMIEEAEARVLRPPKRCRYKETRNSLAYKMDAATGLRHGRELHRTLAACRPGIYTTAPLIC